MRFFRWLSALTILALLCAMLPAVAAEDEMAVELEGFPGEDFGTDGDGLEGMDALDDSTFSLEDDELELDGLENGLINSEIYGQLETPVSSNDNGDFVIDENGVLIRYRGFDKNVVIPDEVKEIGEEAFKDDSIMEGIYIPSSVTYIGYGAFSECTGLKSIVIPDSVKKMGSSVMADCTSLTSVQLSNNLTDLPSDTFCRCSSLETIVLPNGITNISYEAFYYCDKLKDVTLPNNLNDIGEKAFAYCYNLESVTIPASVNIIDRTAFDYCDNVVIRGLAGSYAERFAEGVGIPFNAPIITLDEQMYYISDYEDDYLILYINQSRTLNAIQEPADLARTLAWSSSDSNVVTVDQNGTIRGISQGEAVITVNTADGKGKAAQMKVIVPEPTEIEIEYDGEDECEIILGHTEEITVYTETPYQDETNVEMPVTWSTSNSNVISIEATENKKAILRGNKLGKAVITVTTPDSGKASIKLTVVRPEVDSIKIDQANPLILYVGDKKALIINVTPEEARAKLTWSSWDERVATVSKKGVVKAVAEGWTYIAVETDNGRYDSIEVVVRIIPPKKITLNKSKATLAVGDTLTLKTTITPSDAETGLTWSSSAPKVAKVNQKGKVMALKPGRATITVKTDNGKMAKATITVKPAPKKVKLDKTKVTMSIKEKLTLKASLTPYDAYTTLTWTSSNRKVATVTGKGVVTAKKAGTAVITVRTKNGKTARATITVK